MLSSNRVDVSRPQCEFITSKHPHPAMFGGFGSGKSEGLIIRLITLMENDPGISVGHYFPSYKLAKRRGLSGVQKYLRKIGYDYIVNKSDLTITIPELDNGIYYLDTYHDPDAIVSYEIAHGGVDELDTLKAEQAEHAWRKISERIRQPTLHECGNTLAVASTTDQGMAGFCFARWGSGENISEGFHYIKAGTDSNKFLPDGYVDQIRKNYDPIMAEAFIYGGWVSFTKNKVYHFFDRNKHHTTRTITESDRMLHIGVDFDIGGCCAVVFLIENNNPIAVDEFVSHDTQDIINNLTRYKGKTCVLYPDSSGKNGHTNASQSDISMLAQAGYQLQYKSSNPAIRDRINAYNGLLSHDRLLVNTDKCPNLTNALETQGYDKKGDPEKFDTHPAIDDWCFSGDTKIIVNGKETEFKNIPFSGHVKDHLGKDISFTHGGLKGYDRILAIELDNGKIVKTTKDHLFLTHNGWIRADNLVGETLCNTEFCQKLFRNLTETNITKEQTGISTRRWVEFKHYAKESQEKASIGKSGNTLTGKSKKDSSFITRMKIEAITIFQTLRLCAKEITTNCTCLMKEEKNTHRKTLNLLLIQQDNGMEQKKELSGISNTTTISEDLSFIKKAISLVKYAEKNLKRLSAQKKEISTAQNHARLNREGIAELITYKESARFAKKNFQQTDIQLKNAVVKNVHLLAQKEAVYCLRTENGYFSLSNGLIVSNCDSSGYFISNKFPVIRSHQTVQVIGI